MHPSSTLCTPPATKRPGDSLAAPAAAGQGVCTSHGLRLRLAFSAAFRPSRSIASLSAFRSAFSFLLFTTLIAVLTPATATTPTPIHNTYDASICIAGTPLVLTFWIVGCSLLALVVFHLVMVPAMDWIVRRFG